MAGGANCPCIMSRLVGERVTNFPGVSNSWPPRTTVCMKYAFKLLPQHPVEIKCVAHLAQWLIIIDLYRLKSHSRWLGSRSGEADRGGG